MHNNAQQPASANGLAVCCASVVGGQLKKKNGNLSILI